MSEAVLIALNVAYRAVSEACDQIREGDSGSRTWDFVAARIERDLDLHSLGLSEHECSVVRGAITRFVEQYRTLHTTRDPKDLFSLGHIRNTVGPPSWRFFPALRTWSDRLGAIIQGDRVLGFGEE